MVADECLEILQIRDFKWSHKVIETLMESTFWGRAEGKEVKRN